MEPEVADACPDCGATGYLTCPECYGSGKKTCDNCQGQGCQACGDTGKVECPKELKCQTCGGLGVL